jgi:hypothetical protein
MIILCKITQITMIFQSVFWSPKLIHGKIEFQVFMLVIARIMLYNLWIVSDLNVVPSNAKMNLQSLL